MRKPPEPVINFETHLCELDIIAEVAHKVGRFKNPWTGNKRKLLFDIYRAIESENIKYDSMIDLFSGSGIVGLTGKTMGKRIISNDLMTFSYLFAKAYIENDDIAISKSDTDYLLKNKNKNAGAFVVDNYLHRFTRAEAEVLDNYYANTVEMFGSLEECSEKFCLSLLHVLYYVMESCFVGGRLNKGQVLADLEHRIKHKRNDDKPMNFRSYLFSHPVNPKEFEGSKGNRAYNEDALKLLKSGKADADLAYIDPPYGGQQSDYIAMYRFFEEYIYQSGKLDHLDDGKKFTGSADYYDHFSEILSACSHIKYLVFSYNDSSWADISAIKACIDKHRDTVVIKDINYKYQYRANSDGTEYIIIAR